jgi:hypothetical protein
MKKNMTPNDGIVVPKGFLQSRYGITGESLPAAPEETAPSEFFDWGDLGMGIIGAPVEFASDLWGLADFATGDILRDWESEDLIGQRTSMVGNLTQEILPWLFTFTKVSGFLAKGARIGKAAQKARVVSGNLKGAAATQIFRTNLASAITTAGTYEQEQGTLTDLLNKVPYLQDVVPDFLETDPNDNEAANRLKAGLEDAALGGLVDAAWIVLKGIRAVVKANPELTPREIKLKVKEAIDQDELAVALENSELVPSSQVDDYGGTTPGHTLDVVDVSDTFGAGATETILKHSESGGIIRVVQHPDGRASVVGLSVPEEFRRRGIGKSLQERAQELFPNLGGQVSSKHAARSAYALGRRPAGDPDATLQDVLTAIDNDGSVNLVATPQHARRAVEDGVTLSHWSPEDVLPSNYSDLGMHWGTKESAKHRRGVVAENSKDRLGADKTHEVTVSLPESETIRLEDLGAWNPGDVANALLKTGRLSKAAQDKIKLIQTRHAKASSDAFKAGTLDEYVLNPPFNAEIREVLVDDGYKAIVYKNASEGVGMAKDGSLLRTDSYILFEPPASSVKSGGEIPLPRRAVEGVDGNPIVNDEGLNMTVIDDELAEEATIAGQRAENFVPANAEELLDIAERRDPKDWHEILNPRERTPDGKYKYSTAELYQRLTLRRGMNVSNLLLSTTSPKEMVGMIRAVDLKNRARIRGRTQHTEEHMLDAMKRLKDLYGVDDDGLIRAIAPELASRRGAAMSDADLMREIGEAAMAHELTMAPLYNQFERLMKRFDKSGNPDDYLEAMRSMDAFENAMSYANDAVSEAARIMRWRQTPLGGMHPSEIKKILANQGLDEKAMRKEISKITAVMKANKHLSPIEQAAAINKLLRARKYKFGDIITEYWINSILSGPTTHVANILGNSMTMAMRPIELAMGAAISFDSRGIRAAWEQVKFLTSDVLDAMILGISVEKNEFFRPIGSTKWQAVGPNRNIGRHTVSQKFAENHPGLTSLVEGVGKLINVPGTALETMDNLFKQLNLRGRLKMRLMDKALNDLSLRGPEAYEYVIKEMDRIYANGQLVASETFFKEGLDQGLKLHKGDRTKALTHAKKYSREQFKENRKFIEEAVEFAEEGTFTRKQSKERGKLSWAASGLQQFGAEVWPARFFIPFIGTPTNILLFAADRMNPVEMVKAIGELTIFRKSTPALNEIRSRVVRDLRSGDHIVQKEAMGRIIMGNAMIASVWGLTMQGRVTGRGPADIKERKALQDAGVFQPYSLKVGGNFYSYARLDPYATIIGTAADLAYANMQTTPDDTSALEATMQGLWAAMQNNFTNKSYMTGMKAFQDFMYSDGTGNAAKALRPMVGGFVPSLVTKTLGAPAIPVTGDPTMREVNGMLEYALARVPYFSKNLPPKRNVLGDVVSKKSTISKRPGLSAVESMFLPIQYTEVKDKTVMNEFASLPGTAFYPPVKSVGGLDYRDFDNEDGQDAYDRLQELQGIVTVGGMTMKQTLKKLFKTRVYQAASAESQPGIPSPRGVMINKIISTFRRSARANVLLEYPELKDALRQKQIGTRQAAVANILNLSY